MATEKKITTPEAPAEEPTKVQVSVDKLQSILDKVDALERGRAEDQKKIQALEGTVSDTRLKEATANLDQDKRPRVHFKLIDGKPVVGWRAGKNELIFNPNNGQPVGEKLTAFFTYADGSTSEEMDQIKLTRSTEQVYARVVKDEGDAALLEFEDKSLVEKPLVIHRRFWNA